jgi:hypothetical protein
MFLSFQVVKNYQSNINQGSCMPFETLTGRKIGHFSYQVLLET